VSFGGTPIRILIVLAGLAMLSACNVVMTKDPLFTQADAAGAPTLRPGVWMFFKQPDCKFDETKPFTQWPDCAGGGVVSAGSVRAHKSGAPPDQLEDTPIVLAAGDPRIFQARVDVDTSVQGDASASGDATVSTSSSSSHAQPYGYGGMRPTKLDSDGRIIAFTLWPVQCGPPPPKDRDGNDTALATLKPLPGIEMKKGDPVCTTSSIPALRAAAKASEAWAPQPSGESQWIRDAQR
jgi:hypothetical protein